MRRCPGDEGLRKRIEEWNGGCDEYEHCDTKQLCADLIAALEAADDDRIMFNALLALEATIGADRADQG